MTQFGKVTVEELLRQDGPCLSSILCRKLEKRGLTPEAARQRVSRARGNVRHLRGLTFPKGVRFLYHKATYDSPEYWDALIRDVKHASPAYGPAIAALTVRGGIVPQAHWDIVSGSPVRQRGQVSSRTVLDRLTSAELLRLIDVDGVGACVLLHTGDDRDRFDAPRLIARLTTENILLSAVHDWARKLGMASYNKIALRNGPMLPKYGTFCWDLCGPSYLASMARRNATGKPVPGFLVCDAIAGVSVDETGVSAFLRKCMLLANLRRLPPMMPMLIADSFTREAFQLGRAHGIIMATPTTLFGCEVASGLSALLETLTNAAAVAVSHPEVIQELFNKLGHIEGAAANLRGALFEMIVGHAVHAKDAGWIDIGKQVSDADTGKKAEIDVFRVKEQQEVWVYECKAHQPVEVIGLETVKTWVEDRVSFIYRVLHTEQRFQTCKFYFEFWTCGSFSSEARAYLGKVGNKTRRYTIGFKDGAAIRKYVSMIKSPALMKTLNEHYFKHPIAKIDQKFNGLVEKNNLKSSVSPNDLDDSEFDLDLERIPLAS